MNMFLLRLMLSTKLSWCRKSYYLGARAKNFKFMNLAFCKLFAKALIAAIASAALAMCLQK
jgi:hypothetical protein